MKIAIVRFATQDARRSYLDRLRKRMYATGYEPHQVTDIFRGASISKTLISFSGTDDAERAADVATECRGVLCRVTEG